MRIVQPIAIDDTSLLSSNVSETLYTPYDAGYLFALGDRVQVVGPDLHEVYESLVDNNLGNTPSTSPLKWIYVSTTNPWLMFDQSVTSQTVNADSISVSLQTTGLVPCLALLNVSGIEVRVTMTDVIEGVVYDRTHTLVSDSGVDDWYDYFFEPIVRLPDLIITDLPLYASPIVDVIISAPGEQVKCGTLILGPATNVGDTEHGASVGIQDFSTKDQDEFGTYSIVKRAYRKRGEFDVTIEKVRVDTLIAFLAGLRATPTLYIGTDGYTSTSIFGFYQDFDLVIAYELESDLSIRIEGLT